MTERSAMWRAGRAAIMGGVLLIASAGCQAAGSAPEAACPEPSLTVRPTELERGETFELIGTDFVCVDVFYNGEPVAEKEGAFPVVLEQDGKSLRVGDVEVDDQGNLAAELVTPDDAVAGDGQIVVRGIPVDITVE